jgi:hypothetical protein
MVSLAAASAAEPPEAAFGLAVNTGFCPNGVPSASAWPAGRPGKLSLWGSYCQEGERGVATAASLPFPAPARVRFFLAGSPSGEGMTLAIEDVATGERRPIRLQEPPRQNWRPYDFALPASWRGRAVRLIAGDGSSAPDGWVAFSQPLDAPRGEAGTMQALALLLQTLLHGILLALPCAAVCLVAVRRGLHDPILLGLLALAALGLSGYLAFWVWFFSPAAGYGYGVALPLAAAAVALREYRKLGPMRDAALGPLRPLSLLAAAVGLAALLVLSFGFLYGGLRSPSQTAGTRFSHPLTNDNRLPYLVFEGLRTAHMPKPLVEDWRSSDRPPLATGIVAAQYPLFFGPKELLYTIVSVTLQCLWLPALWLLLAGWGLDRRLIALTLAACLLTGFTFLNTFFVWPKLLAAAYVLAAAALLLTEKRAELQRSPFVAALAGTLVALAMLAHGGSAFALIGLGIAMALLRRAVAVKRLALMGVVALALFAPWTLYQKYFDPPGNRLVKWHLAGVGLVDARPFLDSWRDAYRGLTPQRIVAGKRANLAAVTAHLGEYGTALTRLGGADREAAGRELRLLGFRYFGCHLGVLLAGPLLLLVGVRRRFRSPAWKAALAVWLCAGASLVVWCLLIFRSYEILVTQGSYAVNLLAMAGAVVAAWACAPRVAVSLVSLHVALNVVLYGVLMRCSPAGDALPVGTLNYTLAAIVAVTVVLLGWAFWRLAFGSRVEM